MFEKILKFINDSFRESAEKDWQISVDDINENLPEQLRDPALEAVLNKAFVAGYAKGAAWATKLYMEDYPTYRKHKGL